MERCLMLRLQTQGCAAEVWLNDLPVGRCSVQEPTLCLPVHEYLLAGSNRLELVIDPPMPGQQRDPAACKLSDGVVGACARLLLPRIGGLGHESQARNLAEVVWAAAEGDIYPLGHRVWVDATLPVKFPRWRWLEAPPLAATGEPEAFKPLVAATLQRLAIAMARGEVDSLVVASRLKLEELAVAYQQPLAEVTSRLQSRLQLLHATKALKMVIPDGDTLQLRVCGNGRLLECLGTTGEPALRTLPAPDGSVAAWPLRVAMVNGQCHILR
jgi:hypothetical protein